MSLWPGRSDWGEPFLDIAAAFEESFMRYRHDRPGGEEIESLTPGVLASFRTFLTSGIAVDAELSLAAQACVPAKAAVRLLTQDK
jgi:hypothetical protein